MRSQGALSFDAAAAAPLPGRPVPVYPGAPTSSGRGPIIGVVLAVGLVAGWFVFASDSGPNQASGPIAKSGVRLETGPGRELIQRYTPITRPSDAPSEPPSSWKNAQGKKGKARSIVRHAAPRPMWSKERIEKLSDPKAEVPPFGGEPRKRETYGRKYLEKDEGPKTPLVMIFTQPPGMTVRMDGRIVGRAPYVRPLYGEVTRLDVALSGAGFKTQKASLRPDKEGHFRLNTVMKPES